MSNLPYVFLLSICSLFLLLNIKTLRLGRFFELFQMIISDLTYSSSNLPVEPGGRRKCEIFIICFRKDFTSNHSFFYILTHEL